MTCQCGQPTSGAWLCDDCTKTFRYAIANIAAHYDDLGNVERKQARYGDSARTKGSIGKAQPMPVDPRFVGTKPEEAPGTQLRYDAWATVVAWCRAAMEDQPQRHGPAHTDCLHLSCSAVRRNRWPRNTVTSMVAYLARQFDYIRAQQWAPVMLDEFLDLERRLARMVNRPADRWYAGICSDTDDTGNICTVELYATTSKGTVRCSGCDAVHDVDKRREYLLAEAKDVHVTAVEAASALLAWTDYDGTTKKVVDLIAYWRENGALEDHGVTEVSGQWRKTYRLGDVQDRLIEHAQREQQRRIKAS